MKFRTQIAILAFIFVAAASAIGQTAAPTPTPTPQSVYTRPDAHRRAKNYFKSMFGPVAIAKTTALAGIGTWRNSPKEWGKKWDGFGRRVASGFGKSVIKNSIQFGMDEALQLDSGFYKSKRRDTGSRIRNALLSPFTARNASGKRVFGAPRIVGTYTSNIIAYETWYPRRYGWKNGLRTGTLSLAYQAAFDLVKEFFHRK